MNYIIFDDSIIRDNLLPFTFTRPVGKIRIGILTIAEKWEKYLNTSYSFLTVNYLQNKFSLTIKEDNILINGAVCPDEVITAKIKELKNGEALIQNNLLLAARCTADMVQVFAQTKSLPDTREISYSDSLTVIRDVTDIFGFNGQQIRSDFTLVTKGRVSQPVNDAHTIVYNADNIFIEEGVKIRAAVLNAEDGPIYIGKNAQIQEGSLIKGPFSLGEGAVVNMGGKMRGDNTIGPFCKVGGEISNSVIFGYSNKGHDGFIGNTVMGEWCNLGADTNTSNLKNNYANVKIWNYPLGGFKDTGKLFCGLMMGDHSKAGINTMFNTGTVVGVGANVFGGGFPRTFIPSFSWGGAGGMEIHNIEKLYQTEAIVMQRRNIELDEETKAILKHIYEETKRLREKFL